MGICKRQLPVIHLLPYYTIRTDVRTGLTFGYYWLIYPDTETVSVFRLNQNNHYELMYSYTPPNPDELNEPDTNPEIKVGIFPDLWIDFKLVFKYGIGTLNGGQKGYQR
jgi:hypothetical protein